MAKRSSKQDAAKAKEAKQKKIAIVGAVLFVAVAAIQVPRTMKMLNKKPIPPTVSAVATTPTDTTAAAPADPSSLAAPTLAGEPTAVAPTTTTPTQLVSAVPVSADTGQLETFEKFATKDPFASQAPTTSSGSSAPSSGSGSQPSGGSTTPTATTPTATPPATPPPPPAPAPTTAVLSVNGELMSVQVGQDFPTAGTTFSRVGSIFHLVSLTAKSARVAIVGGSYADGARAIPLTLKKPLTLQNTADGTKYTLILEPAGTPVTPVASGTTTGATSTTPSPVVPSSGSGG